MKIGIPKVDDAEMPDLNLEEEVLGSPTAPTKYSGREGTVVTKYTAVPPNATLDDCMEASRFPYMKFPFKYFNPLQTAFFPEASKDNNVVVCGATSGGKTVICEMVASAILENQEKHPGAKAAYICPLKALAAEKERDWTSPDHFFYKYNVSILTGDYMLTDARKAELAAANIICMSSEMLGSRIRRNQTEKNAWLNEIKALVCDESHLLTVKDRGPNLEVAIMKFTKVNPNARIVFLSATMPNVQEMADWLTKLNGKPTTVIKSDYRPVDLKWNYDLFVSHKYYNANEKSKASAALGTIHRHPRDKFLVFVHTKKMGKRLLVALASEGIAAQFHNADLTREKREAIETSFRSREPGSLRVLVSTSTLAWGLNVPARRALIVGLHRGMSLVEPLDIIQMGGRAGRVGLDEYGDVHVLVRSDHRREDIEFCSVRQPIESKINDASAIAFHIVSEVSEKNVKTEEDAYQWFRRSLAYHQLADKTEDKDFEKNTRVFIQEIMQKLVDCGALKQNYSKEYYPTSIGKVASWFYFCPFDVASWKTNFQAILKDEKPTSADIAWAIGNTEGNAQDYPVNLNSDALGKMIKQFTSAGSTAPGAEKHVFALWHILMGRDADPEFYSMVSQYRMDGERTAQAIELLSSYGGYFKDLPGQNVLLELPYRLRYGLGEKGLELLMLPGVGRKTAMQIMETRRIYTCKDLCASHAMGNAVFSETKWEKVKLAAETIAKVGYVRYLTHLKSARRAKKN